MALLKALCWALIFIIRIRFPPGTSLATVLNLPCGKQFLFLLQSVAFCKVCIKSRVCFGTYL